MRFAFGDEQLLFQTALRDFLRKECTPEAVRAIWASESGHDPVLWRRLAALGVPGALAPEAYGGLGLDERDLVLLLEEAGRAALPAPLVATAAVGVPLLVELGGSGEALAASWLPRIVAGEALVAVGSSANPFVTDAGAADLLVLPHGDELHAVTRDRVALVRQPANDPARRLFSVEWRPSEESCVARGEAARRLSLAALDRGALACAAQLLGAAEQMLDLAVAYAGQREQFGRPIGSFQALQHALADVKVKLEYARPVVYRAAHSVARGRIDPEGSAGIDPEGSAATRAADVSHAKLAAGEAAGQAARTALQIHGAIGYTWEQDLHLWMRRAWSLDLEWGAPPFHRERVAAFALADGARIGPGRTFEGGE